MSSDTSPENCHAALPASTSATVASQHDESDSDPRMIPSPGFQSQLKAFYERNIGLFLVFLAQTCGSVMNTAAKLLTTGSSNEFHPLQVIFVRMSATAVLCLLSMWYNSVPDFPFGHRDVRRLLMLRGLAGFIGLFGLYYSLSYLDISDATVITFTVPTLTALVCFVWLREPFTRREAVAGLVAFTGVLFVARPTFIFRRDPVDHGHVNATMFSSQMAQIAPASASQRGLAIICAIVGTLAAATAYATIRKIGKRAHSMISINYFAMVATAGSAIILLVHPDLRFEMPHTVMQWVMIFIIGTFGFLLQLLLTEGLQRERAGRATNLTYLQLVFALIVERLVWGTTPPVESFIGSLFIIGAAIWISLQKSAPSAQQKKTDVVDEETSLLGNRAENGTGDGTGNRAENRIESRSGDRE